jgi:hypothetical protein
MERLTLWRTVMGNDFDMTDAREIIQWFLDSEPVGMSLGWLVRLDDLVRAVRRIVITSREEGAEPTQVAMAWNALRDAIGPALTEAIVESEHWMCLTPYPVSTVPLGTVVWEKGDRRVVGRRVLREDRFVGYEFLAI